jgi:hypothetical protein
MMKAWMCVPVILLALAGCAGKTAYRDSCGTQLDAAWKNWTWPRPKVLPVP